MSDEVTELAGRLVIGHKRDGRSVYDEQAKAELVMACCKPGASVSRLARECGVNANQLSRWVREQGKRGVGAVAAEQTRTDTTFVAVRIAAADPLPAAATVNLRARLPNGVVVDLHECDVGRAYGLIEALGRLRCSASTKA